jgi:hypothetical protein
MLRRLELVEQALVELDAVTTPDGWSPSSNTSATP